MEFFSDLIARVIPGMIFLTMFFGCCLRTTWSGLNDWQSAILLPVVLAAAWMIGLVFDITSYFFGVFIWDSIYKRVQKIEPSSKIPKRLKHMLICTFDKKANLPYESMPLAVSNAYKLRKLEKHMAEGAMLRSLFLIFLTGLFLQHCWFYGVLAFMSVALFLMLRGIGKKMLKEYESTNTYFNPYCRCFVLLRLKFIELFVRLVLHNLAARQTQPRCQANFLSV